MPITDLTSTFTAIAKELKDTLGLAKAECDCPDCVEAHAMIESAFHAVAALQREQDAPDETLKALTWAERQLRTLVTEDDGNGAYIRGSGGIELAGFGAGMKQLRAAIASAAAIRATPETP